MSWCCRSEYNIDHSNKTQGKTPIGSDNPSGPFSRSIEEVAALVECCRFQNSREIGREAEFAGSLRPQ